MLGSSQKRAPVSVPASSVTLLEPLFVVLAPLIAGFETKSMLIALPELLRKLTVASVGLLALMRTPFVVELRMTLLEMLTLLLSITTSADTFTPPKRTSMLLSEAMLVLPKWICP